MRKYGLPDNCALIEVRVGELKQLYDWWPVRAEARRFDRLSDMTVRVVASATPA